MGINRDKVQAAASKLLQSGKYEKAIAEFRKLVEDDPNDVRTLLKIGDTYVKMSKKIEAIRTYGQVASIYSQQGFHLKAVAVYKQMLRVDGSQADVHFQLAELYQQMGLTSDSLQHFQHVATHYEQVGRGKDSLQVLKRMVQLDPDNLPSRIKLAELFAQHDMVDDAVAELRAATHYLRERQRSDDFVRVAERLLYFAPGDLEITHLLSRHYLQAGDAKAALGKLQICFKTDARNLDTLELIAQAFLDMQQVQKTVSVYKEMARIQQANGQPLQAQSWWQKVLAIVPNDPDAMQGLAAAPAPTPTTAPPSAAVVVPPPPAPTPAAPTPPAPTPPAASPLAPTPEPPPPKAAPVVPPPVPAPPAAVAGPVATPRPLQAETAGLLNETQVFMKYGLHGKALQGIEKAIALEPDQIELHVTKHAVHQAMGADDLALAELRILVQLGTAQRDSRTETWAAALGPSQQPTPLDAGEAEDVEDIVLLSEESGFGVAVEDDVLLDADDLLEMDDDDVGENAGTLVADQPLGAPGEFNASSDDESEITPDDLLPSNMDFEDDSSEGLSVSEADALVAEALASLSNEDAIVDDSFHGETGIGKFEEEYEDVVWSENAAEPVRSADSSVGEPAKTLVTMPAFDDAALAAAQKRGYAHNTPERKTAVAAAAPAQTLVTMPAFQLDAIQAPVGGAPNAERAMALEDDPASAGFADELEEAEFFIRQDMLDEAREILDSIVLKVPGSYRAQWMLRRVEAIENGEPIPPAPWEQRIIDDVDEFLGAEPTAAFAHPSAEQVSVESVISQFKKGVAETISDDDAETHYNLGIAYREMGLYSDAITEFQLSLRAPTMACDAHHLIGLTLADLGNYSEALQAFDAALTTPAATVKQKSFNQYQRGLCLEALGQSREALAAFEQSKLLGADMADLGSRIAQLRKAI